MLWAGRVTRRRFVEVTDLDTSAVTSPPGDISCARASIAPSLVLVREEQSI